MAVTFRKIGGVAAMALLLLTATDVQANPVSIPILNAGFELNPATNGTFPVVNPAEWTVLDPNNILDGSLDAVGVVNPTGTTFYPGGTPEGNNAALIFLSGDVGGGTVTLSQELSTVLQANTTYTLNVHVGNIASGTGLPPFDVFGFYDLTGFPGYRIQLLAGGMEIAADNNSLFGTIDEGTFALSSIQAVIGNEHEMLGQRLEIRLTNLNQVVPSLAHGIEVNFDNVRLTAASNVSAPEPATLWLLGVFGGVIVSRRKGNVQ